MTLALAMVCKEGLILAADTRVAYQDGTIGDMQKVAGFGAANGMFVIVHSADDANAANSLIREIKLRIEDQTIADFADAEQKIKEAMLEWYAPAHDDRPVIQLLVGACMEGDPDRVLYLCQPPNTVSPIYENYKAIGDGWRISDPIWQWFDDGSPWPVHACLCQVSYMVYRAKKLLPGSVGGHTDVGLLTEPSTAPYWIERVSMACAEAYGLAFDRHLSRVASLAMAGNAQGLADIAKTSESIYSCSLMYARAEFHCQFPDKTIRRQFCT